MKWQKKKNKKKWAMANHWRRWRLEDFLQQISSLGVTQSADDLIHYLISCDYSYVYI